nr:NADP-dependent oxidoreductase [Glycomyces terrestris]
MQIDRFGSLDVLGLVSASPPEPKDGEVLVRTVATSLNPVDVKTREGVFGETTPLPATLGWDLAGIVVEGARSGLRTGDRVIAMSHQLADGRGTWADLVAVPARAVAPAPAAASLMEAATLPLAGLTALQSLDWLGLSAGQRLLVTGAGGAVGGNALQIARARGIEVDALVSRDEQVAPALEHGAGTATADRRELRSRAYDAVFDTFGAFTTEAVADGGRYLSVATQAGPIPDLSSRGVETVVNQVREDGAGLRELARLVDDGSLRPRVHAVFGLGEIRAAHERLQGGGLNGKIVVVF